MATKLKLTPPVSYMLGIYSVSRAGMDPIGVRSRNAAVIEKFAKTAMKEFGIEPNKLIVNEGGISFYNSKLKKLFEKALERRTKTFKYDNDYSGNYVAGLFDAAGGGDARGLYIIGIDAHDALLLDGLGIHTMQRGKKHYIMNEKVFMGLVKKHSERIASVTKTG